MMDDKPTYERADAAIVKGYEKAIGECLALGIPVHVNGHMRGYGDLLDDIRIYKKRICR